jgi:hypothetical protein
MSFRHILVRMLDDDIVGINNTEEKNRCIQKKLDYLNCVESYPRQHDYLTGNLQKNNCTQLFWNWYTACYEPKNKYA